jgi:glycosyltransferase involved in cell wall biosynthesis
MKKNFVSVIIPTYNRSAFLKEAIDSVLAQTYKNFELIVVDDGSTDNTREILSIYKDKISAIFAVHGGPSSARNLGIKSSRGEFIAFLDSDDLWMPKKLEKQIKFIKHNPGVSICQTEEIWVRNDVRVNPRKKHKKFSGWIFEMCLPLCIVSPSSVILHRTVFDKVGLFDETMPACEDYDLWLRISPFYQIHLIEENLIIKRGGHSDQQSKAVASLDSLRIRALCKALESGILDASQYNKALEELKRKCFIYGNGCLKRGKTEDGNRFLKLPEQFARKNVFTIS